MARRTRIKKELIAILAQPDLDTIFLRLQDYNFSDLLNPLFSALCQGNEIIRWHAVSVMGWVVDKMAQREMESARVVMRRFLWSLNDESGGIGWGVPEAMAETMACNADLFKEYVHMLLSYAREDGPELFQDGNFLELPALQRGVVWGIGRLAESKGKVLTEKGAVDDLLRYLRSDDHVVRGTAVWALGNLEAAAAIPALRRLKEDRAPVGLYRQGDIVQTTVADLVRIALGKLN